MAYGTPRYRITPDPSAASAGFGAWGVQPSGSLAAIPGIGTPGRKARRGAQLGPIGHLGVSQISATMGAADATSFITPGGRGPMGILPSASTLDYTHKLTTTTLLLAGLVGYLLFGPRRGRTALRQLAGKHVAGG